MQYLEQKNIINPKKLKDETEMRNLLGDIMKLDLNKFSKPRKQSDLSGKRDSSSKRKVHPSPAQVKEDSKPRVSSSNVKKRTTTETNNSPSNVRDEPNPQGHNRPEQTPKVLTAKQKQVYQHHHQFSLP